MDTLTNIFSRKSIRRFEDRPISQEDLHTILEAAMSGPSCADTKDWQFIVVDDKEFLAKMADCNGRPAQLLKEAPCAILICGDLDKAFPGGPEYWVIDGAIAGQNITLAARALGIGSVWLGTWPQMNRVEGQKELFGLPDSIVAHSIIALGYSAETAKTAKREHYNEEVVHYNQW